MQLGANVAPANVEVISTGSLTIDMAIGIGGLPRGRVVEIFGPESSGKTTLALHVIAEAQKAGLTATFIDVEHALDPVYASKVGVDLSKLYLSQPDAGEQALDIADTLVRSGAMNVVVVDSVAALVPKAEIEGDMGDHHVALQARLMSQALRKLNASLAHSDTLIIFINQIRTKVGVMFGSPDVTSGGNALKYYSSVRLDIRRTGQIKSGQEIVGNTTRVKVVKNKLAPPFRQALFDMTYGYGISKVGEIVDLGIDFKCIGKSGAWLSLPSAFLDLVEPEEDEGDEEGDEGDEGKPSAPPADLSTFDWQAAEDGEWSTFAQGKEKAKLWLKEHPEAANAIESRIRQRIQEEREEVFLNDSVSTKLSTMSGEEVAGVVPDEYEVEDVEEAER